MLIIIFNLSVTPTVLVIAGIFYRIAQKTRPLCFTACRLTVEVLIPWAPNLVSYTNLCYVWSKKPPDKRPPPSWLDIT